MSIVTKFWSVIAIAAVLLGAAPVYGQSNYTWSVKAPIANGNGQEGSASFSIGNYAYCGLGQNASGAINNDFWKYDPANNVWTQLNNFPGVPVYHAQCFAIGGKGYVVGGWDQPGQTFRNEVWEYDPTVDSWTQKASYPSHLAYGVGFAIGNYGYAGTGEANNGGYQDNGSSNNFYRFDPVANSWTQVASLPASYTRYSATAFTCGSKGYVGCGSEQGNFLNDFWQYDPVANQWNSMPSVPIQPTNAVGFSVNGIGYIGTGYNVNGYVNTLWGFDTLSQTWNAAEAVPGGRRVLAVAFTIGANAYAGGGYNADSGSITSDFYQYHPCSRLDTVSVLLTANQNPNCNGYAATYTASALNAGSNSTYYWYINNVLTQDGDSTFGWDFNTGTNTVYCRINTNSHCTVNMQATSNIISQQTLPVLTPVYSPLNYNHNQICPGDSLTFSFTASNAGNNPEILWYYDNNLIDSNVTSLRLPINSGSDNVYVRVASNYVCDYYNDFLILGGSASYFNVGQVTSATLGYTQAYNPGTGSYVNPGSQITLCAGTAVNFYQDNSIGYTQWLVDGVAVPGQTGYNFAPSNLNNGDSVTLLVTDSDLCAVVKQVEATYYTTVNPNYTPSVTISNLEGDTLCAGANNYLVSHPSYTGQNLERYFYWFSNGNIFAQTTDTVLDVPPFDYPYITYGNNTITCQEYVYGGCVTSNYSAVSAPLIDYYQQISDPSVGITVSGVSNYGNYFVSCQGQNVTFTAQASNAGPSPVFNWLLNGVPVHDSSSTYTTDTLKTNDQISCQVLTSTGCALLPQTSNILYAGVNALTYQTISIAPSAPTFCAYNANTTGAYVLATVTGSTYGPAYQWYQNGLPVGNNSPYLYGSDVGGFNNGDVISCQYTSLATCPTPAVANSGNITLSVYPTPQVQLDGTPSLCGGPGTIDAGRHQSYLWSTGATAEVITINSAGNYTVTVNDNGCTASAGFLVEAPLATLSVNPVTDTVCPGTQVNITTSVNGIEPGQTSMISSYYGGATVSCNCPAGYVAVGYTGHNGDWMDNFALACKKLNKDGTLDTNVVYTANNGNSTGGGPNGPYFLAGNEVMVGINVQQSDFNSYLGGIQGFGQTVGYIDAAGDNSVNPEAGGSLQSYYTRSIGTNYVPAGTVVTGMVGWNSPFAAGVALVYTPISQFLDSYLWSTGDTTAGITVNQSGSYTVSVTGPSGCPGLSATSSVFVDTVSITGSGDTVLCYGDSVVLTGTGGRNYVWSDGETTASITVKSSGRYSVTTNGCASVNTVNVLVHPAPVISLNGPTTFCAGYTLQLVASYGNNYLWSTGATGDTIDVNTAGTFSVAITDTFGCNQNASVTTQTGPLPAPQLASNDGFYSCPFNGGSDVYVNNPDNRYATYLWSNNATTVGTTYAATGTASVTVSDVLGCTTTNSAVITSGVKGDPSVYGQNAWNVYAWNDGGQFIGANSWSDQYSGYYVDSSLAFNSTNYWCIYCSPSNAAGYQGCQVGAYNMSFSAQRQGFPCGLYQIDIPGHDDAAQLFINGTLVWVDSGCCDVNPNVWRGILDANTQVMFRVTQGGGAAYGTMAITPLSLDSLALSGSSSLCHGQSLTLTSIYAPNYLWSTGETTQAITVSAAGTYAATISDGGCSAVSNTVVVQSIEPVITGCPQNITVSNDPGVCGAVVSFNTPLASDVCANVGFASFAYTGAYQTWVVPANVTSVNIDASGATGGFDAFSYGFGGNGARVQTTLLVTPGQTLYINVGGTPALNSVTGGYNGGGLGFFDGYGNNGGGGGGFTAVGTTGNQLTDTLVIAAGGGGSGIDCGYDNGGYGGGPIGGYGFDCVNPDGGGATLTAGGAAPGGNTPGTFMQGGSGYGPTYYYNGGGGGGGYYGGGTGFFGGGGGGSSYVTTASTINTAFTAGYNSAGNGYVNISYGIPFNTVQTAGPASGTTFPVGTTTVTFTATDSVGGSSTCSFTVTVNDTSAPVISCPANITTTAAAGACGAPVTFNVTATDNCSANVVSTPASGSVFAIGNTTVNSVASDAAGNTATCSFTVTVNPTPVNTSAAICAGSSYNFNGTLLSNAGVYTDTISSASGCDSVVILTLSINPVPVASITGTSTACNGVTLTATGGTSYTWNGGSSTSTAINTFTTSGNYTVTVGNSYGCSATASQAVTINPNPVAGITGTSTACNSVTLTATGGTSYSWNGGSSTSTAINTFTTSGNYTVTVGNSYGCSATASQAVTINPNPVAGITGTSTACNSVTLTATGGSSYSWNGGSSTSTAIDTFNTGGNYTVTVGNSYGCSATASQAVTINPNPVAGITGTSTACNSVTLTATGGTSYTWNGGSSTSTAINTFTTGGNYTVTVGNSYGCSATATQAVTINPNPVAGITGTSTACNSVTLTATGGTSYTWNGGNSTSTAINTFTTSGNYTVTVGNSYGCSATASQVVTVNPNPVAGITGTASGCTSATLTATGGTLYAWSGGSSPSSAVNTFTASGNYTVTVSNSYGCSSTATATVTINGALTAGITGTATGCSHVALTATGGTTYTWSGGASLHSAANTFTTSGTYTVTVSNSSGCTGTASQLVTVNPNPVASITGTSTACGNVTLTASGGAGYAWSGGSNPTSASNSFSSSGTYTVTVSSSAGCSATASQSVTVKPVPVISITGSSTGCALVSLTASGGTTYLWSGGSNTKSATNTFTASGTYTLTVTGSNACSATVSKSVTVNANPVAGITGTATACNVVSLTATGGSTYAWSGGNSVHTAINTFTSSGTYSVTVTSAAGCSATASQAVVVNTPPAAPVFNGDADDNFTTSICPGSTHEYQVNKVTGATTYTWSAPTGCVISYGPGHSGNPLTFSGLNPDGEYEVSVTFPGNFVAGTISVYASNACGNSSTTTLSVLAKLSAPGVISGNTTGVCHATGQSYSIAAVQGATSYTWSVPAGVSITSNNGTAITVSYGNAFTGSGYITVKANNSCGSSAIDSLKVTAAPAEPVAITGANWACKAQTSATYSIAPVSGATAYSWAITGGAVFRGSTTGTSVTVNFAAASGTVNISVKASNACGTSLSNSLAINILSSCSGKTDEADLSSGNDSLATVTARMLKAYPNPTSGYLNVAFTAAAGEKFTFIITDLLGRFVSSDNFVATEGDNMKVFDLSGLAKGVYLIKAIDEGTEQKALKIVVQ